MAHHSSKRAAFGRIVNDLLRFQPEQLEIIIKLARKVRRSKLDLASAAQEADALVLALPNGGGPKQIEGLSENPN